MSGFSIRSVLDTSVWSRNFVAFTLIALVINAPLLVIRLLVPEWNEALAIVPIEIALNTMISAAVTYGVIMELHGTRPSHARCVRRGLAQLAPALGASLLSVFLMMGAFLLLVIPGIIVMLMLWVVVPVAVTERLGAVESVRRSRELTDGHKWRLLVILIVVGALSYSALRASAVAFEPTAHAFAMVGLDAVVGLFTAITAAVAYVQLRQLKEGTQLPELAQAFARIRS